ncbi:MAG: DEAD/DEAH box helicase, partial [Hymenobacteraceae bacterium]|nr:DEAD/DEAH box helicase [Hymenobacteraceae bacterium]MDX5394855.1 DEAD/DEAH box helicase [Hymenobacteraceae bacterium]MDX5510889.1 DEAD/DEAH box helicase [Hymenobacteraceae bacterium]
LLFIIRQLPKERQTLLFSATMPPKIRELAKRILQEPVELNLAIYKPAANIDQRMFLTYDNQKLPLLEHLLKNEQVENMIIFTSRKSNVITIVRALQKMGFTAEGIQSDKTQEEREDALRGFKNKKYQILVATDILSRGIDIEGLSHIVNFDVPQDAEDYIHRIGRTARAGGSGVAITFVNEKDMYRVVKIERLIEREVPKLPLPEFLGEGPAYNPRQEKGGKGGRNNNRNRSGKGRGGNRPSTGSKPQNSNRSGQPAAEGAARPEGSAENQQKPRRKKRYNRKPKQENQQGNKPE